MEKQFREIVKGIAEDHIPAHRFLGIKVLELEQGYVKVNVPFKDEFMGDIRKKRWHGGILATVIDTVGGLVGVTHFSSMEDKLSTVDLRVDYLKSAEAGAIEVEGKLVRMGNRIMVAKMQVTQAGETVAEGKGVYNFVRV